MYFYTSASPDAPQLTNSYGDFNKIVNYIIDGGNLFNLLKIEPNTDKTVKIYYDINLESCPWAEYQTIVVSNSTTYNMSFFIESINIVDKYMICYNSNILFSASIIEQSTDINIIQAKTIASGISRIFGGVSSNRTVIKFDNSAQFRIDDRDFGPLLNPPITTNNSWSKTARVCMSESFDTLDYTANRIWPYSASRPNENFLPSGNYIGQSHIFYNATDTNTQYLTHASSTGSGSQYKVWASNKCMYIQLYTSTSIFSSNSRFYIIGDFDAIDKTKLNGLIQSTRLNGDQPYTYATTHMRSAVVNEAPSFLHTRSSSQSNLVAFNNSIDMATDCSIIGSFGPGSSAPSGAGLSRPNLMDGSTYTSDALLISSANDYVGKLYDIKWINSTFIETQGTVILIENDLYMIILSNGSYSLVKLDRA